MSDSLSSDFLTRIRARLGDRYQIARELMGAGMSRVFVAQEIALDRQIVIKFLPPEIAAEANRDRFRREIQMAARLSHPHIAPLFSAAEDGELLYYTMPYISGESLKQSLEAGRKFGVGETIEILRDVADALAYAHKAGIVHRDIKPANILREGDHAVITDFGVAKAVSFALGLDSRASVATTTGMAIGTPAYMAPEQIAGDTAADHRVDIYAFGLLGYELLTGHAPFKGTSPQAQLAAQLTQAPPSVLLKRPDVPPVLAALIARCLEKDAVRRPPSAEAVLEVLRAVSSASGGVHQALPVAGRRTPLLLGAAGIIAVAGGLLLARAKPAAAPPPPIVKTADTAIKPAPVVASQPVVNRAQADSIRLLSEQNSRREARLIGLLRDSISNAMHRTLSDSVAQVRNAEIAAERVKDSVARATRVGGDFGQMFGMPPGMPRMPFSPEAYSARRHNMGPPRRVGISIFSGTRNPALAAAAANIRDSMASRLRLLPRFLVVPVDSVSAALAKSRSIDSLRKWLKADMWITIYANDARGDSAQWNLVLRDFSATSSFSTQSASSKRTPASNIGDPVIVSPMLEQLLHTLEGMDRAPRREPPPARGSL